MIGAIIGETPASIQDGLGGAIVNFNQYYSTGPERLWATNIICAALGIVFFAVIVAGSSSSCCAALRSTSHETRPSRPSSSSLASRSRSRPA